MIRYKCLKYKDLRLQELYDIMVLRQTVFVVEQNCPYLDADGKDQESLHVIGNTVEGDIKSYTRISPKGISYTDFISISRVVVDSSIRGTGEGYRVMEASLKYCQEHFPNQSNKISAQAHLQNFYANLGYHPVGEGYLEDGIPHIAMIRSYSI